VKDKTTLYILYQVVDKSGFEKIASAKSSKEAWDILDKAYKRDDRVTQVRLQTLRGESERMKMKETKGVAEYISRVEIVANKLSRNRETLPASQIVEKIFRSLMDDFENMVCAIEESKDLSTLTIEELVASLEAYEQRKKKKVESLEHALQKKVTIKKKAFYTQNIQSRGRGRGSRGNSRSGRGRGRQEVEREHTNNQNWRKEDAIHGEEVD